MDGPSPGQSKRPRVSDENRKRAVRAYAPFFSIVFYFLDANKCTDVMAVVVSRKNAKEACLVVAVCAIAVNASSPTRNSSLALRMYPLRYLDSVYTY